MNRPDQIQRFEKHISPRRIANVLGIAILLTTLAELFYLVVWGMYLFPSGSWAGKTVWTLTCGLAMGSVIGAIVLLWIEPRVAGKSAQIRAALVVFLLGSYCAWLCSRIDTHFEYFGGEENTAIFIASGVIPAALGGVLYGWLIYGRTLTAEPAG